MYVSEDVSHSKLHLFYRIGHLIYEYVQWYRLHRENTRVPNLWTIMNFNICISGWSIMPQTHRIVTALVHFLMKIPKPPNDQAGLSLVRVREFRRPKVHWVTGEVSTKNRVARYINGCRGILTHARPREEYRSPAFFNQSNAFYKTQSVINAFFCTCCWKFESMCLQSFWKCEMSFQVWK